MQLWPNLRYYPGICGKHISTGGLRALTGPVRSVVTVVQRMDSKKFGLQVIRRKWMTVNVSQYLVPGAPVKWTLCTSLTVTSSKYKNCVNNTYIYICIIKNVRK
jgi:hypothetical protein